MISAVVPCLAAVAALTSGPALAQAAQNSAPNIIEAPAQAVPENQGCCAIPALTVVEIEVAAPINSRTSRNGDHFAIRLAEPLVVDGQVVLPAGTPGIGEVVHSAKARAMGKAAELILAARYLEVAGQRIPLRSFRYGKSQGTDNSGAVAIGNMVAAAVLPVATVAAFFVPGGEIDIPAGTRATAKVSVETRVSPAD